LDFDILYGRSTDGGANFGPAINLSDNDSTSDLPAIVVSGNNVHVVWEDFTPGNFDIFYRKSTDGGASFTDPIKNLSSNMFSSRNPAVATLGSDVHVIWSDTTPGNSDILYRRSTDGRSTFPNIIKNLSDNAGLSELPAIAVSGTNVHIVWDDATLTNFDILYRRSTNDGSTFPNVIINLSSNAGDSAFPAIAISSNNVYAIWDDDTSGDFEIVYRTSSDDGATFSSLLTNLSADTGTSNAPSRDPDIAAS
jgi:hypothetical protein